MRAASDPLIEVPLGTNTRRACRDRVRQHWMAVALLGERSVSTRSEKLSLNFDWSGQFATLYLANGRRIGSYGFWTYDSHRGGEITSYIETKYGGV